MERMTEKQTFTARELAKQFGVSADTITRHANKLFGSSQNGVTRYFSKPEVTAILKSLQTAQPNQVDTSVAAYKGMGTDLSDELELAMLYRKRLEDEKVISALERKLRLKAESEVVVLETKVADLTHDNEHMAGVSKWLIKGHQKLGEEALAKYGGLPYWFRH